MRIPTRTGPAGPRQGRMCRVRRAITRVGAWTAVTAAAVALSWYGVRSVLRDTVFEPPRAPALGAQHGEGPTTPAPPTISATARASGSPSASRTATPVSPAQASSPKAQTSAPPPPPDSRGKADSGTGNSHGYEVRGGRASFTFNYNPDSATLISATPNPGWSSKVWTSDQWIRVDFTRGTATSSIFVTWNDHPPLAETYEA